MGGRTRIQTLNLVDFFKHATMSFGHQKTVVIVLGIWKILIFGFFCIFQIGLDVRLAG